MQKLSLNVETLRVQTFVVSPETLVAVEMTRPQVCDPFTLRC
ncbi:MAG TPA: hypothetical protein VF746_01795 [Longimicrobium sp.]|jgi:hypothetical protein